MEVKRSAKTGEKHILRETQQRRIKRTGINTEDSHSKLGGPRKHLLDDQQKWKWKKQNALTNKQAIRNSQESQRNRQWGRDKPGLDPGLSSSPAPAS